MKADKKKQITRRKIIPILGTGILVTLIPVSLRASKRVEDAGYRTLLKPDGTAVRVKSQGLKKSKVIRRNITNRDLKAWLKKDHKDPKI